MTETNLSWSIGDVRVTRVEERTFAVEWTHLVPDGAAHVATCRPWIDPFVTDDGSRLFLSVHSFVVETPSTTIVVDTCVGTMGDYKLQGEETFGERLSAAIPGGLDSVDVVVCTHLHFDHVGWNTKRVDGELVPRFANARYLVTAAELDAVRDEEDTAAFECSIEPLRIAGCLDAVAADHRIDDWVTLAPSPGHTPGHVSLEIRDGAHEAVITGDLIHTPLQFAHPDASSLPDFDPEQAITTRNDFVARYANGDVSVIGSHFAPPTIGRIVDDDEGTRFVEI